MKKLLSKIISLTIVFTFIFSSLVYGADTSEVDVKVLETVTSLTEESQVEVPSIKKASINKMSSNFEVATAKTYQALSDYINLNNSDNWVYKQFGKSATGAYLNVEASKTGNMVIQILSYTSNTDSSVGIVQRTSTGDVMNTISNGLRPGYVVTAYVPVVKNTEYQIYLSPANEGDIYGFRAAVVPGGKSGTLSTSSNVEKFAIGSGTDIDHKAYTTYWKMTAKKNGRLTVAAQDVYSGSKNVKITLCNSKKKAISATATLSSSGENIANAYYGVSGSSKGTVYYVKVQTSAPIYAVGYKFTGYTTKPGTKKSNATSISKGKSKSATLAASTSTGSQWYKVKLTKNKSFRINFKGNVAPGSSVKMQLLKTDGKTGLKTLTIKGKVNTTNEGYIKGTVSKTGTYYVKIIKGSAKSSAAYKISYK
ncbi:MAG: hypothetical protein Q4E73_08675 [Lachnospiraceae bacterium]|nr:hypothetical protein [Lachnospiraceae bacterium]